MVLAFICLMFFAVALLGMPLVWSLLLTTITTIWVFGQGYPLEAIFLSLFVLASQNRLADVADRRSQLHLQIDLLAEREMTAVLTMLCGIAARLDVPTDLTDDQMQDFTRPTDLKALARKLDALRDG